MQSNRVSASATPARIETPLKPIRLTDQVLQVLRERILAGTLQPGDRVIEQRVARELGVGQNAVREALIELTHLGFVQRIPNRGTYVTRLTPLDAMKISQVRSPLETLAIELVAERLLKEDLDLGPAARLLAQMKACADRGDLVAAYEFDLKFHRALWELTGNEYLAQLLERIVIPLFAFFIVLHARPGGSTNWYLEAVTCHEKVLEALMRRSPQEAHAAMVRLQGLSLEQQRTVLSEKGTALRRDVHGIKTGLVP